MDRETGTLGKLMRLLDLVVAAQQPLRFSEIQALSGEPRGSVHRQLGHLLKEGLIELAADGGYQPGLRLLTLASSAWSRNEFRAIAAPTLEMLHAATGETVHLGVLRGLDVIYLDKVESRQSVRMHSQIGRASPLYCTGIGKAALSVLPPDAVARTIAGISWQRFTPATITDAAALAREIEVIRACGHAFDREEHEEGIRCVAAPIRSADPGFAAGISVTGPAFRISQIQLEDWAPVVRQAAARISADILARLGPRR
nr:IclR family transcriptional regulator [uncultured Gellertiella sp.]